jgi:hypothetical protein
MGAAAMLELPRWECIELLESQEIGRVCIVEHGYPLAFPITYRVTRGASMPRLVFRTAPTAAIGRYTGHAALEVDVVDADHRSAWSVLARGNLRRADARHTLPAPVPLASGERQQWMTLDVTALSGRRFVSRPLEEGAFSVDWQPTLG